MLICRRTFTVAIAAFACLSASFAIEPPDTSKWGPVAAIPSVPPKADCRSALEKLYAESLEATGEDFWLTMDLLRITKTFSMDRMERDHYYEVFAATKMDRQTAPFLFTHQYDRERPELFGAKSLIVYNFADRRFEQVFWQTGRAFSKIDFHHRDALGYMQNILRVARRKLSIYFELMSGLLPSEWPIPEMQDVNAELLKISQQEDVESLLNIKTLSINRKPESFTEDELQVALGFQFTAELKNNQLMLTKMEVDSSLSTAQLKRGIRVKPTSFVRMLKETLESIDASLIDFKVIEVRLPEQEVRELNQVIGSSIPFRLLSMIRE